MQEYRTPLEIMERPHRSVDVGRSIRISNLRFHRLVCRYDLTRRYRLALRLTTELIDGGQPLNFRVRPGNSVRLFIQTVSAIC